MGGGVHRLGLSIRNQSNLLSGDSIAILPRNTSTTVNYVLNRLRTTKHSHDQELLIQRNIDVENAHINDDRFLDRGLIHPNETEGDAVKIFNFLSPSNKYSSSRKRLKRRHPSSSTSTSNAVLNDRVNILQELAISLMPTPLTLRTLLYYLDFSSIPSRKTLLRLSF